MTDINVLWRIANSTNIRANQRNNATITDADIKKMHYFQQAQATGQKAQFYREYCLPSQNGLPRNYDFQIAAMEFKIEQEHVNSENQMLAPQQIKETIETKMEITTKNDIIERINKLVESLSSLLNEQSIAQVKIYTVLKEYNNFSQYYNNYVNEIANDVQFRSQFINKIVQLEGLFTTLLNEVSEYITYGYNKPDMKGVSMGKVEIMLKDILKTLTLMLDVKPTTPFVNDTSGMAYGQVKPSNGIVKQPINMGEHIDDQAESKYLETDVLPNYGFTEDEKRGIEEGKLDEEGQHDMYMIREKEAKALMEDYIAQQNRMREGIELDAGEELLVEEDIMAAIYELRIDPARQRELWVEVSRNLNGQLPSFEVGQDEKEVNAIALMKTYLQQQEEVQNGTSDGRHLISEKTVNKRLRRYKISKERLILLWEQAKRELVKQPTNKNVSITEKRTTALKLIYRYLEETDAQSDNPIALQELTTALSEAMTSLGINHKEYTKLHKRAAKALDSGEPLFSTDSKDKYKTKNEDLMKAFIRQDALKKVDASPAEKLILKKALEKKRQELHISLEKLMSLVIDVGREDEENNGDDNEDDNGTPKNPTGLEGSATSYLRYVHQITKAIKDAYPPASRILNNTDMFIALQPPEWVSYYNENYQPIAKRSKPDIRSIITPNMIARIMVSFDIVDEDMGANLLAKFHSFYPR